MTASDDPAAPRGADALRQAYDEWSEAAAGVLAKARKVSADELPDTAEALLSTTTGDGTVVRPLYTRKDEVAESGLPGQFPFVRGADPVRDVNVGWRVTERFGDEGGSAEEVNEQILDAAGNGTSGLWLKVDGGIGADGIATALRGVYLDLMPVTLDAGAEGIEAARAYLEARVAAPVAPQAAPSTIANVQSLGLSPYTAQFSGRATVDVDAATALAADAPEGVRTFRVDGTDFSQAGANNPQELGLSVAAAVAHVRDLVAAGRSRAEALGQITFGVSVDDDQFAGIAKLRALRTVWARVADVLGEPDAGAAVTHAVTDLAMLTQRDPWVNMLRSTVAAFGAGVGGADQVTVLGYDAALPAGERSSSASFSHRIARNTQLLLLEESNLGRVLDPAGGSWYVESLTADLAAAAWDVFTEVERRGGYQTALSDGWIGEQIAESLAARDLRVAHRTAPLTGVSEFPNLDEAARPAGTAQTVDLATATPKLARVARQFEALRDRADAARTRPSVLLLPLGSVAEHNGRTTFVANLLAAGGISAINPGPIEPDQIAGLTAENAATVAVLCGTAKRYASDGPSALAAARAAGVDRVLLAGPDREWPEATDRCDGSLRVGIDAVATLTELLDHLTDGGSVSA
ncbi:MULTISPECIES: methylmalonyl-CoA mutase family protein [Gordonia]|uniref:methylmalonyl-CoA mutase n=1 Tax=Gordonia sihwensis NBRC 108236 TaxID=1223544 RepID=L7LEU2_9ACTN|nr:MULTISPECIES: methylmalonyl-CoA mutase family protein [Gordonia]AUH69041.1 methylmalonyl-CoA mutase [Gordonia sp. YC-JH1]MBY4568581.1 methylmalonyl-CoA mutase [Gordonia sihwensis]GAC59645.1 methylmalonyl-CoA mutase small subunit [Gordonia sihwensis NBRC 108236]